MTNKPVCTVNEVEHVVFDNDVAQCKEQQPDPGQNEKSSCVNGIYSQSRKTDEKNENSNEYEMTEKREKPNKEKRTQRPFSKY